MNSELYSNYINREPHPRNARFIQRWHDRLLGLATGTGSVPRRVLEVGPGHGYFALACRSHQFEYSFCDNSPAVHQKMTEMGFYGQLAFLHELPDSFNDFDLIWMSHVLEHCPTWLDARQMMSEAARRLAPGGRVVVVSPDVLTWRREFWNVDWSHGYPTSVRNVVQLMSDVGLKDIVGRHHRNGSFGLIQRGLMSLLSLLPHRMIDRVLTPDRYQIGDGMAYSWKVIFGWRQIFVSGGR